MLWKVPNRTLFKSLEVGTNLNRSRRKDGLPGTLTKYVCLDKHESLVGGAQEKIDKDRGQSQNPGTAERRDLAPMGLPWIIVTTTTLVRKKETCKRILASFAQTPCTHVEACRYYHNAPWLSRPLRAHTRHADVSTTRGAHLIPGLLPRPRILQFLHPVAHGQVQRLAQQQGLLFLFAQFLKRRRGGSPGRGLCQEIG